MSKKPSSNPNRRTTPVRLEGGSGSPGSNDRAKSRRDRNPSATTKSSSPNSANQEVYATNEMYMQNLYTIRQRLKLFDLNVENIYCSTSPGNSGQSSASPEHKHGLSAQATNLNLSEYVEHKNESPVHQSPRYQEIESPRDSCGGRTYIVTNSETSDSRVVSAASSSATHYLPRKIPRLNRCSNIVDYINSLEYRNGQSTRRKRFARDVRLENNAPLNSANCNPDVDLRLNLPSSISDNSPSSLFEPNMVTLERDSSECDSANTPRLSVEAHVSYNTSISEDPNRYIEIIQDLDRHIEADNISVAPSERSSSTVQYVNRQFRSRDTMESTEFVISDNDFTKVTGSRKGQSMNIYMSPVDEFGQQMRLELASSSSSQKFSPLEPNIVILRSSCEESDHSEESISFRFKDDQHVAGDAANNEEMSDEMQMAEITEMVEVLKQDQRQLQKMRWQIDSEKIDRSLKGKIFPASDSPTETCRETSSGLTKFLHLSRRSQREDTGQPSQLRFFNPTRSCCLDIPKIATIDPSQFPEITTITGYLKETTSETVSSCKDRLELNGFREKAEQLLEEEQKDSCGTNSSALRLSETQSSKDQAPTTISALRIARKTQSTLIDYYSVSPNSEPNADAFTDEYQQDIDDQVCTRCCSCIFFPIRRRKYFS